MPSVVCLMLMADDDEAVGRQAAASTLDREAGDRDDVDRREMVDSLFSTSIAPAPRRRLDRFFLPVKRTNERTNDYSWNQPSTQGAPSKRQQMVSRQWLAGRTVVRITATTAENQLLRLHRHCYYYVSRGTRITTCSEATAIAHFPRIVPFVWNRHHEFFFGCHEEDGIRRGEQRGATRTRETACVNIGESSSPRGWLAVVEPWWGPDVWAPWVVGTQDQCSMMVMIIIRSSAGLLAVCDGEDDSDSAFFFASGSFAGGREGRLCAVSCFVLLVLTAVTFSRLWPCTQQA